MGPQIPPARTDYESQRLVYSGSRTSGTLLETLVTCYNNLTSNCTTSQPGTVGEKDVYTTLAGQSASSHVWQSFLSVNQVTETKAYDVGATTPTSDTVNNYGGSYSGGTCTAIGNHINRVCYSTTTDSGANVIAKTTYQYDFLGNNLSTSTLVGGTTYLAKSATYNTNGTVHTATDTNGTQTTYTYGDCNGLLPTNASTTIGSVNLSQSTVWDCNAAVPTSTTDANGKTTTYNYVQAGVADPFYRMLNMVDAAGNSTYYTFTPTSFESAITFNNGGSTVDVLTTTDGFARPLLKQTRQAPGSANFDTVQYTYDLDGRLHTTSIPCSALAGSGCSTPITTYQYDGLNRPTLTTDGGGGTLTYTYTPTGTKYDVTVTAGPAPAGEIAKSRQMEYDGLGRLTSVCEITSGSGSGSCAQGSSKTGFWTKYTYDALGRLLTAIQNAQSGSTQTRTFTYDDLGRLLTENNPENGLTQYFYDTAPSTPGVACPGTYNGDVVKTYDANGNTTCSTYDGLHRATAITYSGPNSKGINKYFAYDSAVVNGATMQNAKTRMAQAYTAATQNGTKVTDPGSSYSARGELTDVYESTPHSGGYYHTTANTWANGALNTLSGVPGQSGFTFGVDGEGRPATAVQGANTLVISTSFNPASQPLTVGLGLGDSDGYQYDPNTGRMTNYTFTVGATPKSMAGNLTWNPNGTLSKLAITDGFNSGGTQTCKYGDPTVSVPGYDDLARLIKVDCTASVWQQNFTYDAFGNLTKTVPTGGTGINWNPGYNLANNLYTLAGTSYDAKGELLNDTFHTYTWDAEGHVLTIDSSACGTNGTCLTYDALERMVEKNVAGTYSEVLYSPIGKTAVMNGNSIVDVYVPLPGGSTFHMVPGGQHFWHPDWLGTIRLDSSRSNRAWIFDRAFPPFGEVYKGFGTAGSYDLTGDTQDTVAGTYDTQNRELNPSQGRWISPDLAGLSAVDPSNPQTWNRYAYVLNNPLNAVDPDSLWCVWEDGTADAAEADGGASSSECLKQGGHWDPFDTIKGILTDGEGNVTQINFIGGGTCVKADCGAGLTLERSTTPSRDIRLCLTTAGR